MKRTQVDFRDEQEVYKEQRCVSQGKIPNKTDDECRGMDMRIELLRINSRKIMDIYWKTVEMDQNCCRDENCFAAVGQ